MIVDNEVIISGVQSKTDTVQAYQSSFEEIGQNEEESFKTLPQNVIKCEDEKAL